MVIKLISRRCKMPYQVTRVTLFQDSYITLESQQPLWHICWRLVPRITAVA